jgi:hypothetical protein
MYEQIIVGAGLILLLVLCLPFGAVHKLVLEITTGALRLAALGLLGAAAYLWFFPEQVPAEMTDALDSLPRLKGFLPDPGTPYFGLSVLVPIVLALLPALAVLDVSRKLAGRRLRRLRLLAARPVTEAPPPPVVVAPTATPGILRRVDRRSASDAMAAASPHKPLRVADRPT